MRYIACMKLTFLGAAGEVTGSCYLLETSRARVLIDFGTHQGGAQAEVRNRRIPAIDAGTLDAVVLSHAHIDHCGRLPLLPGMGCRAPIFCTPPTAEVTGVMLRDAAHVLLGDALRRSRRRERAGREKEKVVPLYTEAEVDRVLPLLRAVPLGESREIAPGVTMQLTEAGHILGAASVALTVREDGNEKRVLFSGDLGVHSSALMRDPEAPGSADVLVMESTYGNRDHKSLPNTLDELAHILREASLDGGKVLIPAFALGRTQQLIYHIRQIYDAGRAPRMPIYIDSPMAIAATALYRRFTAGLADHARENIERGQLLHEDEPDLDFLESAAESKALNDATEACVVIAASGMCTGGRIVHHLLHNLWRRYCHVVICGYQSRGSLGAQLVERVPQVRIFGLPVAVRAKIHTLGGFSAHAGQSGLAEWAGKCLGKGTRLFLTHGEDEPRHALAELLRTRCNVAAALPQYEEGVVV